MESYEKIRNVTNNRVGDDKKNDNQHKKNKLKIEKNDETSACKRKAGENCVTIEERKREKQKKSGEINKKEEKRK